MDRTTYVLARFTASVVGFVHAARLRGPDGDHLELDLDRAGIFGEPNELGADECPLDVDFVEEPCLKASRCAWAAAASEAKGRLFTSQGEGRLREGDEFRQFPQILGGGGQ
jgi:hypothetical protein